MFYIIIFYSFWGQFGERQHKPQTHMIHMGHQLLHLLNEPAYDIQTVHICTEDVKELMTTQAKDEYQFASSGAKNCGYLTRGGKTECKVSGFFLNFKTKQTLNYSSMRDNPLLLTFTHLLFQGQTKLSKSNYQNTRQEGHCFISLFLCPEF